jgi:hypothetical protein
MNHAIDYKYKANKYKLKYLNLKKEIILNGGLGYGYFPKTTKFIEAAKQTTKETTNLLTTRATNYIKENIKEIKDSLKSEETKLKEDFEKARDDYKSGLKDAIAKEFGEITTRRKIELGKIKEKLLNGIIISTDINKIIDDLLKYFNKLFETMLIRSINLEKDFDQQINNKTNLESQMKGEKVKGLLVKLAYNKLGIISKGKLYNSSKIKSELYKNELTHLRTLRDKINDILGKTDIANDKKKEDINSLLDNYISSPTNNTILEKLEKLLSEVLPLKY